MHPPQPAGTLLVLSEADIRAAVDPAAAIESQKAAYRAVVDGRIRAAGGTASEEPDQDSLVFALTGAIAEETGIACKFGYQAPRNAARGLPTVHAFVMLLDPVTGEQLACLNGTTITTMRTAAGVGAAAAALVRTDAARLAVIGSGVQALEAVRMLAANRPIEQVRVFSPSSRRTALADQLATELHLRADASDSAQDATTGADVVVCCTSSREPVVHGSWLAPGSTVLTVGSYQPDRSEITVDCTRRAHSVHVDQRAKALTNCGPVIDAIDAGVLVGSDVLEIGEVLRDGRSGRRDNTEILIFHSLGLGVQDAALGWQAYRRALELGLGERVRF